MPSKNIKNKRSFLDNESMNKVKQIIDCVRKQGDKAIFKYSKEFDGIILTESIIEVTEKEIEYAYQNLSNEEIRAIKKSAKNIEIVCERQLPKEWKIQTEYGVIGEKIIPIERVGCYIPGGNYPLPSTALMTVIPAKVSGVKEIIVCTPPNKEGKANPSIVVAANIAGADRIFKIGGTQAIASMAYGTETIPKVDKIVGPGNVYVTLAKKLVYGDVGIDFLAGPSEVLIVADENSSPEYIAADLLAQAEHDVNAYPILVTNSKKLAKRFEKELINQMKNLPTKNIAEKSLENNGKIIIARNIKECFEIANQFAPEHLEIMVKNAEKYLDMVKNAGSIFIGENSVEALGDYVSGTNHVLPTSGLARARGGLSVRDFLKFVSYQKISTTGIKKLKSTVITLARLEGLEAHARSVEIRGEKYV